MILRMSSRQDRILRVLSRICVGIVAFCLTLMLVLILGVILLSLFLPMDSAAFFHPEVIVLLLFAILVGWMVAVLEGIRHFRYTGKRIDP